MAADFVSLLPPGSTTPYERAIEQTSGERWLALDVDIIRRYKDPWTCPEHLLNFLAFERSVDIWDETWDVLKKRAVIASAPADHRLKGTEAGTRRYIDIAGGKLIQTVTRPQAIYATPNLSKAEWDAYIARHPKVRITLARATGRWRVPNGTYVGRTFVGRDCISVDTGPALHGRRAYLLKDGVQTPLQIETVAMSDEDRIGKTIERVIVPGRAAPHSHIGQIFVGASYIAAWNVPTRAYSFALDRQYLHRESSLSLTAVPVGYMPRDTRYVRESMKGERGPWQFVGDHIGQSFIGRDRGGELLADVLHVIDPAIPVPKTLGASFIGHGRIGMPAHRAELLIDWRAKRNRKHVYIGRTFAGHGFIGPSVSGRRALLLSAVAASKRLSDRIAVSFETVRPRTYADGY
ncbi:phage tail protein I, partial [Metarhizobium album]